MMGVVFLMIENIFLQRHAIIRKVEQLTESLDVYFLSLTL